MAPIQSSQQVINPSQGSSRRTSVTILPGEGRRTSLISTQSPPAITPTHAYASLISSDNKLRKSLTGKILPDHAVSAFEQTKERRRSRAFFESDRRKDSVSPHKRDKRATPAMITLRKASIHYKCDGFGTMTTRGRSGPATIAPDRLQGEANEALLRTPRSGSAESSRSSVRHPLMEASPVRHRTEPTDPALTVTDAFANLPGSDVAPSDTQRDPASIVEAKRQSSTTRVHSLNGSQEIIWKKDGSPSSWSNNHSRHSSIISPVSSHDSEDGGVPLPPSQFPPHASATLPTLVEEHPLDTGIGPPRPRLAILGDSSGGWPWNVGPSPAHSGVEVQTIHEHSPQAEASSVEPLHVPRTRRTNSSDTKEEQAEGDQSLSNTRSVSFPLVMPEIDIDLHQLESDFKRESTKGTVWQLEQSLEGVADKGNNQGTNQDPTETLFTAHSQGNGRRQPSNHDLVTSGSSSSAKPPPEFSISPPSIHVVEETASVGKEGTQKTDDSQTREYVLNTPLTSFVIRKGPAKTYDGTNDEESDNVPVRADLKGGMAKSLLTSLLVKEMFPAPAAQELQNLSWESQCEISDYCKDQIPEQRSLLGHRSMTTGPRPGGSLERRFSLRAKATVLDNGRVEVVACSTSSSPKKGCQKRSLSQAEISSRRSRDGSNKIGSPKKGNVRFLLTPGM